MVTHSLVTSKLDYCKELYMGTLLKSIQKLNWWRNHSKLVHVTSLLYEVWISICFWVQLKMLVILFRALYGFGLGYLQGACNCNSYWGDSPQLSLSHLISTGRRNNPSGKFQVMLTNNYWVVRRRSFSAMPFALWNFILLIIRLVLCLLTFHKTLKTWFCAKA